MNDNVIKNKNDILQKNIYYSYITNIFDFTITPLVVGYEKCRPLKSLITCNKSCYIMHYVLSGEGIIIANDKTYKVGPNQLFLFPPHINVKYKQEKNNPWSYIWIEFNGSTMKQILSNIQYSNEQFIFNDNADRTLEKIFKTVIYEDKELNDDEESMSLISNLFRIFTFLFKYYSKSNSAKLTREEQLVKSIIDYINANYSNPDLTMSDISKKFFLSQSYMNRIFKKETDITPIQYLDELKMKKAIELLNHKAFTIEQISDSIGYKNQFYFTRRFKKYYGMPPSKYKQKNSV